MFRDALVWLLSVLRIIKRPFFKVHRADEVPLLEDIANNQLYLIKNGATFKWSCFQCPGGCGEIINLSMSKKRRPRWSAELDWLGRITINPSVHQLNNCKCHFFIRNSQIEWCLNGKPKDV